MNKFFYSILFLIFYSSASAQIKHDFTLAKSEFLLDGKPFKIISGELHPARIPREYWKHRIQMAKAMGCNTIAAYVFWNYHEKSPGVFDFKSENRDIAEFIRLCQGEGMWVLLRPGPYVCGEWDLGGIPPYLLQIPDIKLRCSDLRYMEAVTRYINTFAPLVAPLQCVNGGPILMVQVENEYGSFGNDKEYLENLRQLWVKNGVKGPFYTSDGATPYMLDAGAIDGAAIGLDPGVNDKDFAEAYKRNPDVPSFSSETYPGWLTHWGEEWANPDTSKLLSEIKYLLDNKKSFNFYVVHGGTNFGFTAGANAFKPTDYKPDVTSYDYDAPISEQGVATPKYFALRNLIAKYSDHKLPNVPKAIPSMEIPEIEMQPLTTIWDHLPVPVKSAQPQPMEIFGQYQGYIMYRTKLVGHKSGKLTITEPHDIAQVYLNGKYLNTIYRDGGSWTIDIPKSDVKDPVLEILVEGMGRINFAQYMIDRKGITDRVNLNGMTLMNWEVFNLPFDSQFISTLKKSDNLDQGRKGYFFQATVNLKKISDTYLDMSNYTKGVVWVNGHNLGRYWEIGPQKRLYCPASWLKKGENKIIVFDSFKTTPATIKGVRQLL